MILGINRYEVLYYVQYIHVFCLYINWFRVEFEGPIPIKINIPYININLPYIGVNFSRNRLKKHNHIF